MKKIKFLSIFLVLMMIFQLVGLQTSALGDDNDIDFSLFQNTIKEVSIGDTSYLVGLTTDNNRVAYLKQMIKDDGLTCCDKNNNLITDGQIGTGATVFVRDDRQYTVVLCGDLNGDGAVNSVDVTMSKRQRSGKINLQDMFKLAAFGTSEFSPDHDVTTKDVNALARYNSGRLANLSNIPSNAIEIEEFVEVPLTNPEIKIMSFNLNADDSTFEQRKKPASDLILSNAPDSFGVQECRLFWRDYLTSALSEKYDYVGVSCDGENAFPYSFGTYIFYRKDIYTVVDSGTLWLSKTPDEVSAYPLPYCENRTCTWAILQNKATGYRYVQLNAHLDWRATSSSGGSDADKEAFSYQWTMIRNLMLKFEKAGMPVFANGDFNHFEGYEYYNAFIGDGIADSKFEATTKETHGLSTTYNNNGTVHNSIIDFIFCTPEYINETVKYEVLTDRLADNGYISDHYPLISTFKLASNTYEAPANSEVTFDEQNIVGFASDTLVRIDFDAATSSVPVQSYQLTIKTKGGTTVFDEEISAQFAYNEPAQTFSKVITGLAPNVEYVAELTAKNLIGIKSNSLTAEFSTISAIAPQEPTSGTILSFQTTKSGVSDTSANNMEITALTAPALKIDGAANGYVSTFDGTQSFKVNDFKNHYAELSDGFSVEAFVKFNDVDGWNSVISNMHAGGFGLYAENGKLVFEMHVDGSYKTVKYDIKAGTYYHIVVSYDGSLLSMYINGTVVGSEQVGSNMQFASDEGAKYLAIGADSSADGNNEGFLNGSIKYATIYEDALSYANVRYLYSLVDLDAANPDLISVYKYTFTNPSNIGWNPTNNVQFAIANSNILKIAITGGDPYMYASSIPTELKNINLSDIKAIRIKMINQTDSLDGQLFFTTTDDTGIKEEHSFKYLFANHGVANNVYEYASIDCTTNSAFTGTLNSMRLDIVGGGTNGETCYVESIEFIK